MSGPDVISGAPPRGGGARRPRRLAVVGGTVALAAVAALLAARSAPDRPERPVAVPTLAPAPSPGPDGAPSVVTAAVGQRAAYALVASCGVQIVHECSYQVWRRDVGGERWEALPVATQRRTTTGLSAQLYVSGDDTLTVVDDLSGRLLRRDDSTPPTGAAGLLRAGPPVAAVTGDGILTAECARCTGLTVLEPGTGRWRPLAAQPPLGRASLRSYDRRGQVIWAVGTSEDAVASAVSRDLGRSWRSVPVRGLAPPLDSLRVSVAPDGGAYLLGGRDGRPEILNEFSELWQVTDPVRAQWRRVTPATRPRSALSMLVGSRGLLIGEETGEVWRLQPTGTLSRLPDATADGQPVRPGYLSSGPSGLLVALPYADGSPGTVLVSSDEGETWRSEQVTR